MPVSADLYDPDSAQAAGGIPDPVLAEIGAERTGQMREIVSTIQREQGEVIRAPIDQCLVDQGGPGTGKTAVGLHHAAYLLFEHRRRLLADSAPFSRRCLPEPRPSVWALASARR
jgi:DNA helicase IV